MALIAQYDKKHTKAVHIQNAPKIDGLLDDACWANVPVAGDFVMDTPNPGLPLEQKTEVKIVYDHEAMYIGYYCYDTAPDSILRQLSGRDQSGNSDICGITFSCYRDGINGFTFSVTPNAEQTDARIDNSGEDLSWNAVWYSKTKIVEDGWIAEYKIPFAAIRFPDQKDQIWNINFIREVRRTRHHAYWNGVDPLLPGYLTQMGTLEGIQDIKPPRRIFFYPYASTYYNTSENAKGEVEGSLSYNAGLDLKLGLSDAFTMDVTLIPDFGQTLSDQQILNLSAFEVQFTENRQFFTEGTELFSRANIFYSRRIGFEKPINYYDAGNKLNEHEKLLENPLKDQIVNAIKISGRDKKNLGIGFFNAVTKPSYAISIDTTSGIEREIQTSSLTNYNVFVLDQILPNNSYVSVINTSVIRGGEDFDVNVLGGQFEIRNKLNKYSISGSGAMSAKYGRSFSSPAGRDDNGFREEFNLNKIKGNFLITIGQYIKNDTYDPTDLGFLTANNLFGFYSTARYIIYKPFGRFNKLSTKLTTNLNNLYRPSNFTEWNNIFEGVLSTKRFNSYGINFEATPVRGFDFFEPRVSGRFFRTYTNQLAGAWYSSDYRKKIAIDLGVWYTQFELDNRHKFNWRCAPRFRLNDHLFITYVYSYQSHNNDIGFAYAYEDDARTKPLFGTRDVISHTNVLNLKYAFNPTMTLNTRVRHYWGYTRFKEFHSLMDDGYLGSTTMTSSDQSFNSFTIDMIFSWILKPGSELSLVWKNAIVDFDDSVPDNLTSDFDYTFSKPQNNSYSVKLIYFVDYHSTSRKMKERLGLLKD